MSVLFPDNPGTSLGEARFSNFTQEIPEQSPDWIADIFPNNSFIDSEAHTVIKGFCRNVLLYELPYLGLRYWDVAILVPNLLFSLFLILNARHVLKKITNSKSPVFRAFFLLVYLTTFMNIVRCIVSMSISATNPVGELVDKILWISLKFFYMTSELSVLTFALLFGHLDSSTSIRRALIATLLISLAHTGIQSVLELKLIDQSITDGFFDLHSEGGLIFWMLTSAAFALIYLFVLCLPLTCVRRYVTLPSKCSFYLYCILLSFLNILQALGAVLLFFQATDGMCFVDFSTYLYFCFYTPIVYVTFLRRSLKHPNSNSGNSLFSYRKQRDEHGSGDLPDSYYPRFSGLTSPSYDDLFDCSPRYATAPFPDAPLMLSTAETAESTVTTRTGSDEWEARHSGYWDTNMETRHLKGLGADGSLVFDDDPYPRWHR
ncbi:unnamed protein product [Cylicocyclus nassatus]|uniref:Transmembrane protein adipocyte-associated 1 homolog n=2 Tax=Strongylidae TaxID=27830 RepID=A0AA36MAU1_CYLNA|nr:unnamed protein product [Cylicocyclus nassatus]